MKFSPRAVSSIAAAAMMSATMSSHVTIAAPIVDCSSQSKCLDFTFECIASPICNDECEWRVCMTLNLNKAGCVKDDTVSHTCVKPDDECMPDPGSFTGAMEVGSIGNGYFQCQVVPPGGLASFLLKDGNARDGCGSYSSTLDGGGSAMCETLGVASPTLSCTGNVGKECVWSITAPSDCDKHGGGGGDPHIKLWNRTRFSYHGECDLVMLDNKDFAGGLGLDVHIRTTHKPFVTIPSFYSFIESAAIRIGSDILEFTGDDFWINGVQGSDSDLPTTMAGYYPLHYPTYSKTGNTKYYQLDLNNGDKIIMHKFGNFLSLDISGKSSDFGSAGGLLGDYHTSGMLARDGTILHNADDFGSDWQVRDVDPKLFRTLREPQHPHAACKVPEITKESRRHLREDGMFVQAAEAACAHKSAHDYEFCVHDVLATKDIGMAEAW